MGTTGYQIPSSGNVAGNLRCPPRLNVPRGLYSLALLPWTGVAPFPALNLHGVDEDPWFHSFTPHPAPGPLPAQVFWPMSVPIDHTE